MLLNKVDSFSRGEQVSREPSFGSSFPLGDYRVVLLKLFDRLHNMRTLGHMKPAKQRAIADETHRIFDGGRPGGLSHHSALQGIVDPPLGTRRS